MPTVRLFHWNAKEAPTYLDPLRSAGYTVLYDEKIDTQLFASIRRSPPDAVIISLARLPSHGRELAGGLRHSKATRHVPIVFADGAAEKVEAVRRLLPDAVYTSRERMLSAPRKALANPPTAPVVPVPMMQRYSARTAAQKLGMAEASCVTLIDPPRDYRSVIGQLPKGVELREGAEHACPVTLWFVEDSEVYQSALPQMRALAGRTKLWVLWPKQSARRRVNINQQLIRSSAIALGLVDYKICSVNDAWSALLFAVTKASAPSGADRPVC